MTSDRRPMSVEEAQANRVCRVCGKSDRFEPGDSLVLNYGQEYAHRSCLGPKTARDVPDVDRQPMMSEIRSCLTKFVARFPVESAELKEVFREVDRLTAEQLPLVSRIYDLEKLLAFADEKTSEERERADSAEGKLVDKITDCKRLTAELAATRQRLLTAAGDDLCRLTQEEIKAMTSGSVPIPPLAEFLASCERFHAQVADEAGVNNNCLTLAQLVAENEKLTAELADQIRMKETWKLSSDGMRTQRDTALCEAAAMREAVIHAAGKFDSIGWDFSRDRMRKALSGTAAASLQAELAAARVSSRDLDTARCQAAAMKSLIADACLYSERHLPASLVIAMQDCVAYWRQADALQAELKGLREENADLRSQCQMLEKLVSELQEDLGRTPH